MDRETLSKLANSDAWQSDDGLLQVGTQDEDGFYPAHDGDVFGVIEELIARADREAAARLHAEQEREGVAHELVRERVARDEADAARKYLEALVQALAEEEKPWFWYISPKTRKMFEDAESVIAALRG